MIETRSEVQVKMSQIYEVWLFSLVIDRDGRKYQNSFPVDLDASINNMVQAAITQFELYNDPVIREGDTTSYMMLGKKRIPAFGCLTNSKLSSVRDLFELGNKILDFSPTIYIEVNRD